MGYQVHLPTKYKCKLTSPSNKNEVMKQAVQSSVLSCLNYATIVRKQSTKIFMEPKVGGMPELYCVTSTRQATEKCEWAKMFQPTLSASVRQAVYSFSFVRLIVAIKAWFDKKKLFKSFCLICHVFFPALELLFGGRMHMTVNQLRNACRRDGFLLLRDPPRISLVLCFVISSFIILLSLRERLVHLVIFVPFIWSLQSRAVIL